MSDNQSNNKRIAKNTIYMYIRMGITMIVGLYTSRVVLQVLGVEDYGLYNVIGGVVIMLCLLNNAMVNTTSRYITIQLAENNDLKTRQIFNMASLIHVCIAVIVLFLAETVGLWYVVNKLVIPTGKESAAFWLYQLSILTAILSIFYVPYNATIIAHERMSAFAFIQILDVILKLLVVIALKFSTSDKLILYGALIACISLFDFLIYFGYCKRFFKETEIMFYWSNKIFKEMLSFIGWALVGNFSFLFYTHGINLMLNAFCGPAANAARGIAVQVENIVRQFANNVQVAINPQILKSYASSELERMYTLIFASSRYCFYLLFIISLPVLIETKFILNLWLGQVPEHTINFIRLILCTTLLDAFINPMFTANLASGKLKLYNLSVCSVSYTFMIITYFAIKITRVPESVFACLFVSTLIGVGIRILVLYKQIGLKPYDFFNKVIKKVIFVVMASLVIPVFLHGFMDDGLISFIIVSSAAALSVCFFVYSLGINKEERNFVSVKLRMFMQQKCSKNVK